MSAFDPERRLEPLPTLLRFLAITDPNAFRIAQAQQFRTGLGAPHNSEWMLSSRSFPVRNRSLTSALHPMLSSAGLFSAKPGWESGMQSVGLVHSVSHNPGEVQL